MILNKFVGSLFAYLIMQSHHLLLLKKIDLFPNTTIIFKNETQRRNAIMENKMMNYLIELSKKEEVLHLISQFPHEKYFTRETCSTTLEEYKIALDNAEKLLIPLILNQELSSNIADYLNEDNFSGFNVNLAILMSEFLTTNTDANIGFSFRVISALFILEIFEKIELIPTKYFLIRDMVMANDCFFTDEIIHHSSKFVDTIVDFVHAVVDRDTIHDNINAYDEKTGKMVAL